MSGNIVKTRKVFGYPGNTNFAWSERKKEMQPNGETKVSWEFFCVYDPWCITYDPLVNKTVIR